MNPLTLVKRIQNINAKEASLGISEDASWHAVYKQSAYVYVGGIPFELTEGDLLAVFAQYGEIVDVNLVRDKGTGKSKGYAFVAYEDQRSTNLAVDNLNGAQIRGRIIRVDHVSKYKKKEEEDEELEQQKREERGVCRAFQKGECTRGDGCKFSHNAQRAANTGWGADDHKKSRRGDDKFGDSARNGEKAGHLDRARDSAAQDGRRSADKERRDSRVQVNNRDIDRHHKRTDSNSFDPVERALENRVERQEKESYHKDNHNRQGLEKRSRRHEFDSDVREHDDRRVEKGSTKTESVSYRRESSGKDKRSLHDRDSSPHRRREIDEDRPHKSRR
ncbi:Zinc finger CCCH domain-containing protein 42 [Heracleum sosnowskyi]|uniref:Zinc finger CCCH domain-containing protein 42 n=1 Tax=Heracleum sosnowskyi TaxID=360622 RepID=A0AAD8N490_9APIA|nr:Zinc finger CCCH domain-containing protein 42 [Heracleum sosnowskyi]